MSPDTHRIYNRRQQPLELHLTDQVVTLPPGGSVDVALGDERPPQLALLERDLLVDVVTLDVPAKAKPRRKDKED